MIPDEKFEKRDHLLKTGEFMSVYKKGRSTRRGFLVMYYLPNGLGRTRIGFSIGAAKVKLATARNRIRRLLREAFRKHKRSLKPGHDLVVVVSRKPEPPPSYADVETLFLQLLGQVH